MKNITNEKFGKLTAIEPFDKPYTYSYWYVYKNERTRKERTELRCYWKCKCDCGNSTDVNYYHLINGNTKSCGCLHHRNGKDSPFFKGYGEIPLDYFSIIKRGAKGGGILNRKPKEFDLTIKYIWELFLKQNRKCALSGIDIGFEGTRLESKCKATSKFTASLDRIDSSKGYVVGNVQWVHKHINIMKNEFDRLDFLRYCKAITDYNNENKL
jgi:hypothetical protein